MEMLRWKDLMETCQEDYTPGSMAEPWVQQPISITQNPAAVRLKRVEGAGRVPPAHLLLPQAGCQESGYHSS